MQTLYNPILALIKSSVLVFLLRLEAGVDTLTRWLIHIVNTMNICQGIATFVAVVFQCSPVEYYWLGSDPHSGVQGTCIRQGYFYVTTAGLTILTDVMVLGIPIGIFSGLQMKMRFKIALIGLFSLGVR